MRKLTLWLFFPFVTMITLYLSTSCENSTVVWKLDNTNEIGELSPIIIGDPQVQESAFSSILFNGKNEGVILPINPLKGYKEFTVEVFFNPSSDGSAEQRFVHFQDKTGNRGLVEIRLNQEGSWYLDTYLHVGETDNGHTLKVPASLHQCNKWYWAALTYDGKTMRHFVNAHEEVSGEIDFGPMEAGLISIGVRLNQVYWFKGKISEIRIHPKALKEDELQKITDYNKTSSDFDGKINSSQEK